MVVRGAVQGVGFRPFVYRLATELKLNGWVSNSAQGVFIEVEGRRNFLEQFRSDSKRKTSPRYHSELRSSFLDAIGTADSKSGKAKSAGKDSVHSPGYRDLRRLPPRNFRSNESSFSLSIHQLHELRSALFDHRSAALRPGEHVDEEIHDV